MGVILCLALFIGVGFLIDKALTAASKATNKHVLFRSEYKTERELISDPLTFTTTAAREKIERCLNQSIAPVPKDRIPLAGRAVIYEKANGSAGITYAFGNKASTTFTAVIAFRKSGEKTYVVFKFAQWLERSGMLLAPDQMKDFRQKVCGAFQKADPDVRIAGAPRSEG